MIGRRKGIIALMVVVCVAAAAVYLRLTPPIYTSQSEIYYQQNTPRLLADEDGRYGTFNEKFLGTEARVIRSPAVLAVALDIMEAAARDELDRRARGALDPAAPGGADPAALDEAAQTVFDKPDRNAPPVTNLVDLSLFAEGDPLRILEAGLSVELGTRDDILTVSFSAPSAIEAQTVVAAVVEAYQTFQKDKRQLALDALTAQREKVLSDVRAKNQQIAEFLKAHGALSLEDDGTNLLMQRVASLSDAMTTAQLEAISARAAYEEAAAVLSRDPELLKRVEAMQKEGDVLSTRSVAAADQATLRLELFNLQQRLAEAKLQYMSGHPIIQTIQGRIDELSVAYVAAAREHWLAAERHHSDLERSYEDLQKQVLDMQTRRQEYMQLNDELHALQRLAAEITDQHNRMTVLESVGPMSITVLQPATLADKPSAPRPLRTLMMGLLAGVLSGMGLGLLLEWRDQRLHSADDVKQVLGVPVLGIVPAMRRDLSPARRGMNVHFEPASEVAEAYRTVRTAVYFGLPDEHSKTILITSPMAGDGKSTLVANLAIAMAQAGRRVLIVDADLRHPAQHRIFSVDPAAPGLAGVLQHTTDPDSAIIPTGVVNLDLLPSGPVPRHPSDLLNSQDFSDLLGDLAAGYDHVLLDSPALMGAADARIAAAWCDATVLVLHAEKGNRRMAALARDGLLSVGANLVGVVINDVDRNSTRHGFFAGFDSDIDTDHDTFTAHDTARPEPAPQREPLRHEALQADAGRHGTAHRTGTRTYTTPQAPAPVHQPAPAAVPDETPPADTPAASDEEAPKEPHPGAADSVIDTGAADQPTEPVEQPASRRLTPSAKRLPLFLRATKEDPTAEPKAVPDEALDSPSAEPEAGTTPSAEPPIPAAEAGPEATDAPSSDAAAADEAKTQAPRTDAPATPASQPTLSERLAETSAKLREHFQSFR